MSKHTATATRPTAARPAPRHRRQDRPRTAPLLVLLVTLLAILATLAAATLDATPAAASTTTAPAAVEADAPPATDTTIDALTGAPADAPTNPEPYWAEPAEDGPTAAPQVDRMEEDDPRWQCWADGNEQCGATVVDPATGRSVPVVITYVDGVADSVRFL